MLPAALNRLLAAGIACLCVFAQAHAQQPPKRTVHVFVALADNQHQGIVPVPARLGNGSDPEHNLNWGARYGVKTFFLRSADWSLLTCGQGPKVEILERCVFKHRKAEVLLVADAYRGDAIQQAILDFLDSGAGAYPETITVASGPHPYTLTARGGSSLVAYVGHDGLMDSNLPRLSSKRNESHRDAIILACASKQYFAVPLSVTGAFPLLWTTGLMAPEAYTLKSALDGWINHESNAQIQERAAATYDKYQKCGIRGARRLFATGY